MNKEQAIDAAHAFEVELTALVKRYELYTYSFLGFIDSGDKSGGYPVCIYWVREGMPLHITHPQTLKMCFMASVNLIKAATGRGLIHEYYSGFGRPKPEN